MNKLIYLLFITITIAKDIYIQPINGSTTSIAKQNGILFYNTIVNASINDRVILGKDTLIYMIPYQYFTNLNSITIELNGIIYLHNNISAWNYNENTQSYDNAIDIRNSKNITITSNGNGIIDGQGYTWWISFFKGEISRQRPTIIYMENCIDSLIERIVLLDGPRFHIYAKNVLRFVTRYLTIWVEPDGFFPYNTDGIDVSGKDIYIHHIDISNYDDAICVKPLDMDTPSLDNIIMNCSSDILVEHITVYRGVGLSIGSVASTKNHCIKNVVYQYINVDFPIKLLYIKTGNTHNATTIQGYIHNITYQHIKATHTLLWPIYIGPQQQKEPDGTGDGIWPPVNPYVDIQSIFLNNISIYTLNKPGSSGIIRCDSTNPCKNIILKNVNIYNTNKQYICSSNHSILGSYDNYTYPYLDNCGLNKQPFS